MKEEEENMLETSRPSTNEKQKRKLSGIELTRVALKTTLGAGLGVAAGVFGTLAAVHVLEMAVPALLITKAAGVVGGTAGMLIGLNGAEKKKVPSQKSIPSF